MDGRLMVGDVPQINKQSVKNILSSIPVYHPKEDILFISPGTPRPAVSFDINGELWIRFNPETKEVVGLEIENFESIFLKKHPEVVKVWKDVKPLCSFRKSRAVAVNEDKYESFILILIEFFKRFLGTLEQQTTFGLV